MKPCNLAIFHEDKHLIVCQKPAGVATESSTVSTPDMVSLLKNYLHQSNPTTKTPYLGVIHRLDQPVT